MASPLLDTLTPIFSFLRCSQHNYEVRGLTGLVDLYVMTGNQTYLDAALGGWAMLRESWQHVGGSLAINEEVYFPPKSYCERSKATQIANFVCMLGCLLFALTHVPAFSSGSEALLQQR